MTAVIIARQRDCIFVATDGATYSQTGETLLFTNKVLAIPHLNMVITNTGSAGATPWMAIELAKQQFSSFDDMILAMPYRMPKILKACPVDLGTDIMLAGISEERGPESYVFRLNDELPMTGSREEVEASPYYADAPGELVKLPDLIMTPIPTDQVIPANFEGVDLDGDVDSVTWSLKKIITMQRHMDLPRGIPGIGGFAQLTTISADGITQRILQRWAEDKIGPMLRHDLIDWSQWHRDNPKPGSVERKPALRLVQ